MLFSKTSKVMGSVALSVLLTNIPAIAMAEPGMIPTYEVVSELNRAQTLQRLQDFVSRADVQKILVERGLTAEEASARLASLSESELKQLSGQIEQARAGGDILMTILVVVLIIFLIKRI